MAGTKSTPKDAQVMMAILKDMGVTEYEPRVVNQMLEFTYRYVTDILDDAKVYSNHANKKNIDVDDVKLAIQCRLDHSFTTPPPRDLLMDVARHKNNNPLPMIRPYTGPKLPPDRYCLSSANYRLKSLKKPRILTPGTSLVQPRFGTATTLTRPTVNVSSLPSGLTLVTRAVTQPVSVRPTATIGGGMPIIRVTPGTGLNTGVSSVITTPISTTINPLKRKREDGDDGN